MDSHPGKGSCFRLQLEAERTQVEDVQEAAKLLAPSALSLNILVAEDHAANRLLLCQQLEYLGHRAVPCDDGETAFAQWESADPPFDLTITDCNMPRMDGYELTRRIRSLEQSRGLGMHPIFGLTANAQSHIIQDCLDAGMTQCLFKPLSIETLTEQVGAGRTPGESCPHHWRRTGKTPSALPRRLWATGERNDQYQSPER